MILTPCHAQGENRTEDNAPSCILREGGSLCLRSMIGGALPHESAATLCARKTAAKQRCSPHRAHHWSPWPAPSENFFELRLPVWVYSNKKKNSSKCRGRGPGKRAGRGPRRKSGDMRLSEKTDIASGILMAAEIVPEMVAKMLASYLSGRILSEMLITAWDAAALMKTQRAEGSLRESAL